MKQFRFAHHFLSLAAAFLVALTPAFHCIHLMTCRRHSHCSLKCDNHTCREHSHDVSTTSRLETDRHNCPAHDPDTCPICRSYISLMKGAIIPALPPHIHFEFIDRLYPIHVPDIPATDEFSTSRPRAPPAC